ncbi:MAG: class I SAM-dependent methyltransferase [Candidatus Sumerlaeota bacterium]|nr:class I SAM-dependent methyltransferase [Candidatus Sumerlaeota bacterium]
MDLDKTKENWDAFGRKDPLFAIASWPEKKGNLWNPEEFFQTGAREIQDTMQYVESLGVPLKRDKALDFGCGVGRLTQALAEYFDEVIGIDIAPSMIELARKYNRHGERCRYVLNESDDLRAFPDSAFQFIYSNITLQHLEPVYTLRYLREFIRILAPGGLLLFQLPSERLRAGGSPAHSALANTQAASHVQAASHNKGGLHRWLKAITPQFLLPYLRGIRQKLNLPPHAQDSAIEQKEIVEYREPDETRIVVEMHGIKREEVTKFLEENGASILDVTPNAEAGPDWTSYRYCVSRK